MPALFQVGLDAADQFFVRVMPVVQENTVRSEVPVYCERLGREFVLALCAGMLRARVIRSDVRRTASRTCKRVGFDALVSEGINCVNSELLPRKTCPHQHCMGPPR